MKIGKPDGENVIFVGMHRAPMLQNPNGIIICGCGSHLQNMIQYREHWQQGHCDSPVYASLKEIIEAGGLPKQAVDGGAESGKK